MTFLYFSVTLATASLIGGGVGAHHGVDLVLGDELLVELDRGGGHGLIVVDDELDLASEQPALGVHLLEQMLIALLLIAAGLGVRAGERHRRADLDRGRRLRLDWQGSGQYGGQRE